MTYSEDFLDTAHEHAFGNRPEITASDSCGCFSCFAVFPSGEVWEWIQQGKEEAETGFCPYCMLDTALGDHSGLPVQDEKFLGALNERFFGSPPFHDQRVDPQPLSRPGDWKKVGAKMWVLERQNRKLGRDAPNK